MIAPEYYRSTLTPDEQFVYRVILNGLLQRRSIITVQRIRRNDLLCKIIQAVHLDHPELFYINFWHLQISHSPISAVIHPSMLLEANASAAVTHTLDLKAAELGSHIPASMNREQTFFQIAKWIARSTRYQVTGSFFWDHTVAGPVLRHGAVCEGIAKLFLFYCQRQGLPCAVVTGSLNGIPHAWNMVETDAGIKMYIDMTKLLNMEHSILYDLFSGFVLQSASALHKKGYIWRDIL